MNKEMKQWEEALHESLYEFIDCDGDMDSLEFKGLYDIMMQVREMRREFFNGKEVK